MALHVHFKVLQLPFNNVFQTKTNAHVDFNSALSLLSHK